MCSKTNINRVSRGGEFQLIGGLVDGARQTQAQRHRQRRPGEESRERMEKPHAIALEREAVAG
ncbi:hypothetical protein GCM10023083_57060 [Streptomyces phyllanthi]